MTETTALTHPNPMAAFHTRAIANEGLQLPLYLPTGEKSEHWVRILGVDSDEFRIADSEAKRDAVNIMTTEDDKTQREVKLRESKRRLIASLVLGWSFEHECTREAVIAFLREAPQIEDAIDRAASRRSLFFAAKSLDSENLPSTNSSST